ncbi:GNAT family N-acetyltransferase [Microbacterium sp. NPDC058345]|uniref:GNAT family N-acetyltransferase n=1 Tax=Microbacterium sp. NPDC058345 TaxID=3346455 RepID=UPI00365ACF15
MTDTPLMVVLTEDDAAEAAQETKPAEDAAASRLVISDDRDAGVFEGMLEGTTAAGAVYTRSGKRITLLATSVFPQFRGRGIAAALLAGIFDEIRANGDTVTITCPFAARFVAEHPEYADVIDTGLPGVPRRQH